MTVTIEELDSLCGGDNPEQQQEQEQASRILTNPATGVMCNIDDLSDLLSECMDVKQIISELRSYEQTLREHTWSLTQGTTKTRYLESGPFEAKVEAPPEYPSSSILKEAWNAYPDLRDRCLSIKGVGLKKREWGKLSKTTTDDPALESFLTMVKAAVEQSSVGTPSVSVTRKEER